MSNFDVCNDFYGYAVLNVLYWCVIRNFGRAIITHSVNQSMVSQALPKSPQSKAFLNTFLHIKHKPNQQKMGKIKFMSERHARSEEAASDAMGAREFPTTFPKQKENEISLLSVFCFSFWDEFFCRALSTPAPSAWCRFDKQSSFSTGASILEGRALAKIGAGEDEWKKWAGKWETWAGLGRLGVEDQEVFCFLFVFLFVFVLLASQVHNFVA